MEKAAFLSHNIRDKDIAREVALFITAEGIPLWFDEWEISAGDSIIGKVEDGLASTTTFILLWSRNAHSSNWVTSELRSALTNALALGTPRIIPIVVDDTPLPLLVRDIRYVLWDGGSEAFRIDLVRALLGRRPSDSLTKLVVRKYRELIGPKGSPHLYQACPECGSQLIQPWQARTNRDDLVAGIKCLECGAKPGDFL